jgi:diadenosine tetraphosphate (Ap4A) HIT family hydrolase/glutathione S-transferase
MTAIGLLIAAVAAVGNLGSVSGFHLPHRISKSETSPSHLTMATETDSSSNNDNILPNADHILFDVPVSNNGARCRIILYKKEISNEQVTILSPAHLGGLKSEDYKKLSPLGLMPCLTLPKPEQQSHGELSSLVESDTIARYLLSKYATIGPSFQPENPKSNLIARMHDMYLTTIQGCLYKPASRLPLGDYPDRKSAIEAYRKNWNIIESFLTDDVAEDATYLCGKEVSLADATLFPSAVFATYMLPKFDSDLDHPEPPLPPKLTRWFDHLRINDSTFTKVYDEIMDTMVNSWENTNHRWDSIRGAGVRDTAPSTIFDLILNGSIPATIVRENEHILAFKDINPLAPAHILLIPKDRNGLTSLRQSSEEHIHILGQLLVMAGEIAKDTSLGFGDGARIVINDGKDGGQEVQHLHVHVLGGRQMESTFG